MTHMMNHCIKLFKKNYLEDRNASLFFVCCGIVRNLYPQQGHQKPSHIMNVAQILHRRCPEEYLLPSRGLIALYLTQIPLQTPTIF